MKLEEIIETLAKVTKKTLVLEFVSLEDDSKKVLMDSNFWKNKNQFEKIQENFNKYCSLYNLENLLNIIKNNFNQVSILESSPLATRTLLVCTK